MKKYDRAILKKSFSFLSQDKSMSLLLASLVITVFIIYPIADKNYLTMNLLAIFIGINFLSGVFSLTKSNVKRTAGVVLTMLVMTLNLGGHFGFAQGRILEFGLWIVYFAFLSIMILMRIFVDDEINYHRIQGAIAVYIIFGMMFSFIYLLIYHINPGSFIINERLLHIENRSEYNFLYFSFVTLCTLGYGDITPASNLAQSFAILEALLGILFPAILIARLVSLTVGKKS